MRPLRAPVSLERPVRPVGASGFVHTPSPEQARDLRRAATRRCVPSRDPHPPSEWMGSAGCRSLSGDGPDLHSIPSSVSAGGLALQASSPHPVPRRWPQARRLAAGAFRLGPALPEARGGPGVRDTRQALRRAPVRLASAARPHQCKRTGLWGRLSGLCRVAFGPAGTLGQAEGQDRFSRLRRAAVEDQTTTGDAAVAAERRRGVEGVAEPNPSTILRPKGFLITTQAKRNLSSRSGIGGVLSAT